MENEDLKACGIPEVIWINTYSTPPTLTYENKYGCDGYIKYTRPTATPADNPPEGFMFATGAELFQELGMLKPQAETAERGLNAVMRRQDMKAVTPTDGDAEIRDAVLFALEREKTCLEMGIKFKGTKNCEGSDCGEDWLREANYYRSLVKTALQTRTPPVPVDTISIKREVLQGVREAIKDGEMLLVISNPEHLKQIKKNTVALASLDAVLSEGKS